jgi:hypothetical protein
VTQQPRDFAYRLAGTLIGYAVNHEDGDAICRAHRSMCIRRRGRGNGIQACTFFGPLYARRWDRSTQPARSLVGRDVERDLIPMMRPYGLGLTAWSPVASGFLSGNYARESLGNCKASSYQLAG